MTFEVFEELKHLIIESGIPPTRLARESTVCPGTIDKWLDGTVQLPRIDTMLKVARIVGKDIELTGNLRKLVNHYGSSVPQPPRPRSRRSPRPGNRPCGWQ